MLPIQAMTVTARATGAALGESGTKKTPQVEVAFEITTAEYAGERITWYGFLTDKTQERTIEALRYAGWRGTDLADLSDLSREDVPNVELVIAPDTYEGKTSMKVQFVNRIGGRIGSALPADKAKALAAKFRGVIASVDQRLKAEGAAPAQDKPPF
jgi:hypothetical protein